MISVIRNQLQSPHMTVAPDQSQNQDVARQSEAKLQLIIESAPYAMIIVDKEGRIVFVNSQTEKTFGYSRKELIGQLIEILIPQRFRTHHSQDRSGFNAHPTTRPMGVGRELAGLRKDGSQVPVEIGLTAISSAEGFQILASIVDISERKRLEMERQRLEREVLEASEIERKRIGQELHDSLGQQLLGIAFLSDALKEKLSQKSLAEKTDAGHIAKLIEKVMTQARELSRGLYAAELESQGLCEALRQLASNVNATTNIHCQFICNKDFEFEDMTKATHAYRIIQEALHNARKHSMATEIILTAKMENEELGLTVKDNGIGISNASTSTGMGLKLMRYRADIIDASFHVSNNKDGGTVISCVIPLKNPTAS